MTRNATDFAESVMGRIRASELVDQSHKSELSKRGLRASAASAPSLGHPEFEGLALGESGSTTSVAMFLDLRRFTARSFWDSPEQILRLNVAVITELAIAVQQHGGYVLGFRGDGVFACFDGGGLLDARAVAGIAVGAAAWALDAVQNSLNSRLELAGIEPVQVRVGLDFGRLDFVRIGSDSGSEVNVLGFAANFASKCEKAAKSWEVVAGESLALLLPPCDVTRLANPVRYMRQGESRTYHLFDVNPTNYLRHIKGVPEQLDGHPISEMAIL